MKFLTRKFSTGVAATFFCATSLGAASFGASAARSDDRPQKPTTGAPAAPSSEVRNTFSYPLDGVQLTYEGVTYTLDGSLSGIAAVRSDGAGGFHVRAQIKGDDLQVTLPDGTTYQGSGTGSLVANARAPRDGVSVFGALTKIKLKSDGEDAGKLKLQLRLRGTIDAQHRVTLTVIDARVMRDATEDGEEKPGGETRSTFSYPLDGVQLSYQGVTYNFAGTLSGISAAQRDGAGGVHIRARIKSDELSVTTSDGKTYRGTGLADVVANARAPRDGVSVFGALAKIRLASADNSLAALLLRLRGTVDAKGQVSFSVIEARISDQSPKPPRPGAEVRSEFSYPLNGVQLTYEGVTYTLDGSLSGLAAVNEDGSGGVHVRARLKSDDLTVTLPDGTSYRGTGFADVVANARAPRGGVSVFNAITKIQLVPLDTNNTGNFTLQVRVRGTIDANHQVVLTIIDARVLGAPTRA